ncbi:MAG: hypothetical protein ABFS28_13750 [Bacteroidota bacterium]
MFSGCEDMFHSGICNNLDASPLTLNDTIEIKIGEQYCNPEEELLLVCDSLVADSRCPIGVVCVWEGNAEVSFILGEGDHEHSAFHLNTHNSFRTDTIIQGYRYQLIDVLPYPEYGIERKQDEYSILMIVSKDNTP